MSAAWREDEVEQAYEALRAQATGELPSVTARGLALFLSAGVAAWMKALPRVEASWHEPQRSDVTTSSPLAGLAGELVRLLVEMTIGGRRGMLA